MNNISLSPAPFTRYNSSGEESETSYTWQFFVAMGAGFACKAVGQSAWNRVSSLDLVDLIDRMDQAMNQVVGFLPDRVPGSLATERRGLRGTVARESDPFAEMVRDLAEDWTELRALGILTPENRAVLLTHPDHAKVLALSLCLLEESGILTPENRAVLVSHPKHAIVLVESLCNLNSAGILTPENRAVLTSYPRHAENLAKGLCGLNTAGILTQENRDALIGRRKHKILGLAIDSLAAIFNLTQPIYDVLIVHPDHAKRLAWGLCKLDESNLLTPEIRAVLLAHPKHARELARSLVRLHENNILTPETRSALFTHPEHAWTLAGGLHRLFQGGNWTRENRLALFDHAKYACHLADSLNLLNAGDLLTQENRLALFDCAEQVTIYESLHILNKNRILTQENFDQLFLGGGAHARALQGEMKQKGKDIHTFVLDQDLFDRIMRREWISAYYAARILSHGFEGTDIKPTPDVISEIARKLMPDYERDRESAPFSVRSAHDVASKK